MKPNQIDLLIYSSLSLIALACVTVWRLGNRSPDDSMLVSCSIDNKVIVWRLPPTDGQQGLPPSSAATAKILNPLRTLEQHTSFVKVGVLLLLLFARCFVLSGQLWLPLVSFRRRSHLHFCRRRSGQGLVSLLSSLLSLLVSSSLLLLLGSGPENLGRHTPLRLPMLAL